MQEKIERVLTFKSCDLIFAVGTQYVVEIITNYKIRTLPVVPSFIRGIINLRGQVLPVNDLRLKMGQPFKEYTANTCIIILKIDNYTIGLAVDGVLQVQDIDLSKAQPIPTESQYAIASGMIGLDDGKVALLMDGEALIS